MIMRQILEDIERSLAESRGVAGDLEGRLDDLEKAMGEFDEAIGEFLKGLKEKLDDEPFDKEAKKDFKTLFACKKEGEKIHSAIASMSMKIRKVV